MLTRLRAALRNDSGASAVEYGLLVAAIAAVVVGIVFTLGRTVSSSLSKTNTCIKGSSSVC
jgi:pilus assembly protein Flp/PilA